MRCENDLGIFATVNAHRTYTCRARDAGGGDVYRRFRMRAILFSYAFIKKIRRERDRESRDMNFRSLPGSNLEAG